MKNYQSLKKELLQNKQTKKAYDQLGPQYAVIEKIIKARLKQQLSQSDLAKRLQTKQSAISRLESGQYNPSLNFLYRIADALEMELTISLK